MVTNCKKWLGVCVLTLIFTRSFVQGFREPKQYGNIQTYTGNDGNGHTVNRIGSIDVGRRLRQPHANWICPRRCNCNQDSKTQMISVNCARRKLSEIPEIPVEANTLMLNNNRLSIIRTRQLSNLADLIELDLSNNRIQTLEKNAFMGLSKLQTISLRSNALKHPKSVPPQLFQPLPKLTTVYLDNNCKSLESCEGMVSEITTVTSLQLLYLDGYPGMIFTESFRNLTQLVQVGFGEGDGKCDLNYITNETFLGLSDAHLDLLDVGDCNVKHVEPGSFSTLVHLRHLTLGSNRELCHEGWRNVTFGLNSTSIETLDLSSNCVNLHPNNHVVEESDLSPLFTTRLVTLDLHHCNLQVIEPGVIINALPRTLQRLILYNNDLNNAVVVLFLPLLTSLEYLDISVQNRYNYANVPDTDNVVHVHANASMLDRRVTDIDCHIKVPIGLLMLPYKLSVLNASNLNLEYAVPSVAFDTNNSLEVFDAARCLLPWICGKISGLHHLKYLNLSSNKIRFIGYDTFTDMPLLEDLNLSDNPLGDMFNDDQSAMLFQNVTNLTTLDLSSGNIKKLPYLVFSKLKNLRILKLSNNALETLQFGIEAFVQTLQLLDVSGNSIKYLPDFLTSDLDRIVKSSEFILLLSHNKLKCDCQYLPFTKWLANTNVYMADRPNITCNTQNESLIDLHDLQLIQGQIDLDCITWIVLTVCVSFFLCSITILGLVTALYRQRWKLRYLYYASLKRANPYMLLDDQSSDTNDVYLSFDEDHVLEDGSRLYDVISVRVVNALIEQGIHARIREDLSVGKSLNSEISSAIQQSRKTVIFLSRDYCKEFWNTFEFNMAAYDGMYTNRKVIVPVVVGQVGSIDLLPEMKMFLNKEVVITFSLDRFEEFIEQLCYAISK